MRKSISVREPDEVEELIVDTIQRIQGKKKRANSVSVCNYLSKTYGLSDSTTSLQLTMMLAERKIEDTRTGGEESLRVCKENELEKQKGTVRKISDDEEKITECREELLLAAKPSVDLQGNDTTSDKQNELGEKTEGQEREEDLCELCNEIRLETHWIECDKCETWICEECHKITEDESGVFRKQGVVWLCKICEKDTVKKIKSSEWQEEESPKRHKDEIEEKENEIIRLEMENRTLKENMESKRKEIETRKKREKNLEKRIIEQNKENEKLSNVNDTLKGKMKEIEEMKVKNDQTKSSKKEDRGVETLTVIAHKGSNTDEIEQIKESKRKEQEIKKLKNDSIQMKDRLELTTQELNEVKRTVNNLNNYVEKIKEVNEVLEIELRQTKDRLKVEENKINMPEIYRQQESAPKRQGIQTSEKQEGKRPAQEERKGTQQKTERDMDDNRTRQESMQAKSCKWYRNGFCKYGDSCKFAHVKENNRAICKYNERGMCKYGNRCRFYHRKMNKVDTDKNSDKCWQYDQWGECKYGKDCKFSHGRRETVSQRSRQEGIEEEINEGDRKEEQNRKLDFLCEEIKNTRNQMKQIIMYHNLQQAYQQQMQLVSQQQ